MKKLIFTFFATLSVLSYAQTDISKDSLPSIKNKLPFENEKLNHYLNEENLNKKVFRDTNTDYQLGKIEKLTPIEFYLPPIEIYSGPPIENNSFIGYPFANDYNYNGFVTVANNIWITTSSERNTYPALGEVRMINARLNYQPSNWLIISGGPYASKYTIGNPYAHNDYGANAAMKFILHDRIRLNAYGQYSANGKKNGIGAPMWGMYPQSYYGGTIEVKINQKFGIEGGVMRELDPFSGKWVNIPYLAPVFYSK